MYFLLNLLVQGGSGGATGGGGISSDPLVALGEAKGVLSDKPLPLVVSGIINAVLGIVGILLLALIVYGGFIWMKARGNEKEVERAQQIITNSVIGLVIVLVAYAISYFVINALVTATTAGTF